MRAHCPVLAGQASILDRPHHPQSWLQGPPLPATGPKGEDPSCHTPLASRMPPTRRDRFTGPWAPPGDAPSPTPAASRKAAATENVSAELITAGRSRVTTVSPPMQPTPFGRSNPCKLRGASTPKAARSSRALTAAEATAVADRLGQSTRTDRYSALVLVLTFGGLRFGEAAALRRSDVLDGGDRLRIERAVRYYDGRWVVGEPKTNAGHRTVALPASVRITLVRHMDRYMPDTPDALVFGTGSETFLSAANFGKTFRRPRTRSGWARAATRAAAHRRHAHRRGRGEHQGAHAPARPRQSQRRVDLPARQRRPRRRNRPRARGTDHAPVDPARDGPPRQVHEPPRTAALGHF